MSRSVQIVTPENVCISLPLAGCASRLIAGLIDLLIQFLLMIGVSELSSAAAGELRVLLPGLAALLSAASTVAIFLVLLCYPTFFELMWGGRTPGKRLFGLKAVRVGGYPLTFLSSVIRNVMRLVDLGVAPLTSSAIILFGLPGLAAIFVSPEHRRIGDYAAGTMVIRDAPPTPLRVAARKVNVARPALAAQPDIDGITINEYAVLRRYVDRRDGMDVIVQAGLADKLLMALGRKPGNGVWNQLQLAELVEATEKAYSEEHGIL